MYCHTQHQQNQQFEDKVEIQEKDLELQEKLIEQGLNRVKEKFDIKLNAQKVTDFYKIILRLSD